MTSIRDFLQQRCDAGAWGIGQIAVSGMKLRHAQDKDSAGLEGFRRPEDARELAKYDDAGNYRPLKSAPNLRRGWQLELGSLDELRRALDFFYPAAVGTWIAHERGELHATALRGTLGRQSGMYRVTQLITDEQAREVIRKTCVDGCLRQRLWEIENVFTDPVEFSLPLPVLCAEACNLLVAACRPMAKQNLPKAEASS